MRQSPPLRPKVIRPALRDHKPSYFQMHVYDQELQRLTAERAEIAKRVNIIEERVDVVRGELQKLDQILKRIRVPHSGE